MRVSAGDRDWKAGSRQPYRKMASHMVPSWNQIEEWLKELELLRQSVETTSIRALVNS